MKIKNYIKNNLYEKKILNGEIPTIIKPVKILSFYIIPSILLFISMVILITNNQFLMSEFGSLTGSWAISLIMFLLIIKPLFVIFPNIKILGKFIIHRRSLGVLSFYFIFFHFILELFNWKILTITIFINSFTNDFGLLTGFIATIIFFILYLTSNNYSVKLFKKNWKLIQRLVYVGLVFSVIHISLIKGFGDGVGYILFLIIYFYLKYLEWRVFKILTLKEFIAIFSKKN